MKIFIFTIYFILTLVNLNAGNLDNFIDNKQDNIDLLIKDIKTKKNNGIYLNKLKALSKDNAKASFYYASLIEKLNKEKSIKWYKHSIDLGDYRAAYNLGLLYLKLNNEKNAIIYLKIALNNKIYQALLPLAKLEKSKKLFKIAISKNIENATEDYLYFLRETNDKNYDNAIENAYKNKINFTLMANRYFNMGQKNKGINILKEGISYNDKNSLYELSYYYLDNNPDNSIELLKNENTAISHYIQGLAYFKKNKLKKSLNHFRIYEYMSNDTNRDYEYVQKICKSTNYCLDF